ncbi:hypothetical protein CA838_10910 [Eikenella corrodens]|nr:hypothetical protein CA838_10910 [Eikenella corrodens]
MTLSGKNTASVDRILVSDKTFNIPVVAIHCSNAQNVGFENPTYRKLIHTSWLKTQRNPFQKEASHHDLSGSPAATSILADKQPSISRKPSEF